MTEPKDPAARVSSLAELPRDIRPPRDLWPQIAARLDTARASSPLAAPPSVRRPPRLQWLAAAAMVASVAVGVWIGRSVLPSGVPGPVRTATTNSSAAPAAALVDAAFVTDPRYQRQRAALLQSLQAQLATMPPETRTKVLASLATIEKAKQDLEGALGKDPGNALLQELLVNTYQDEMRVLTDVHEAGGAGQGT
jgi:hypothetical protein